MKSVKFNPLTSLVVAAALAIGLTACGGGSSTTPAAPPPPPHACDAGASQACVDARKAELAALGDDASKADHDAAEMALAVAQKALDDKNAKEARQALVAAAACTDATAECVDAHDALIAALQADVDRLAADEGATNAQQAAAQKALSDAEAARDVVQMALRDDMLDTETGMKVEKAKMAAAGLEDERTAEDITAAEAAIAAAEMAIAEGDDPDAFMDEIAEAKMAVMRAKARNAVDMAVMDAQKYSAMLTDDQSKAAVEMARMKVDAAKQAVMDNADALTDADEMGFNAQIELAEAPVGPLESKIAADAEAEKQRMAEEEAEKQRKANAAMAATAAKLYAGINAPAGDGTGNNDYFADYNDADQPATGDSAGTRIMVTIGTGTAPGTAVALSEDKKTTVSANHGWAGKKYTHTVPSTEATGAGDMYEAVVYSNVEAPKMGRKFGSAATVTPTGAYEYELDAADRDGNANKALRYFAKINWFFG